MTNFAKEPIRDVASMPPSYTIKPTQHGTLLSIYKNDRVLRQQQKTSSGSPALPIWFKAADRARAIEYARQHAELGLDANQQVPNFDYRWFRASIRGTHSERKAP